MFSQLFRLFEMFYLSWFSFPLVALVPHTVPPQRPAYQCFFIPVAVVYSIHSVDLSPGRVELSKMTPTMQVSALVAEMQETLGAIHDTLTSLDSSFHDEKLDKLEKKRHDAIQALSSAFSAESELLDRRRRAERDMIAELRRKEDEEREEKRREEDEKLAVRDREEDIARDGKLEEDIDEIEQETDKLMTRVEGEAHAATVEGRDKLKGLQERRRASYPLDRNPPTVC